MTRQYTNRQYLVALQDHVMIFDGAMGTNLQTQMLTTENFGGGQYAGCNDHLVLSYPQAVEKVHHAFLQVGVDVIETCTFRANRLTLKEYGLESKVEEINLAAAELARKSADEYSTSAHPRFVAGSIGPSGKLPSMNDPELSNIELEDLIGIFREQASALIRGGADLLVIETSQDILEVKCAIQGIHKAFAETGVYLPIQTQVTLDQAGRMLLGTDASAVLAILDGLPIDVIGLNCSTGPQHMREPISYFCAHTKLPVSCIPNAGLPVNVEGNAVYPLTPDAFTSDLSEFVEKFGVSVVGGCCGTTPEHLQQLVSKLHYYPHKQRTVRFIPSLSSAVQSQAIEQEPRPFLIGERLNTQGSSKFKQMILDNNYDGALSIARQQVNSGAHGLDVCSVLTERKDESESMVKIIKVLGPVVRVPLVIDSTDPWVIEQALMHAPGRCLINSTNLEDLDKTRKIFSLAKSYNAAVIILTIDEKGMATTAEEKVKIARRAYDLALNAYELKPSDLVIDALTFTLGTGQEEHANSALETMKAISQIKQEIPGVYTSLGVSNVSFGLEPEMRAIINSVFLFHAVRYGLDMAIVNPAQIIPYSEISKKTLKLAEDTVLNRKPNALHGFLKYWRSQHSENNLPPVKTESEVAPAQKLHWHILHRVKEGLEQTITSALNESGGISRGERALELLNLFLLPAMKEVGDKFGKGELILPFVLQSAEVMKNALSVIEPYLSTNNSASKGTIILATVYGDVHDIGKNLAKTILANNGYTVIDLGKQVPAQVVVSKVQEIKPLALGLSALLVSTSQQMGIIVNELRRLRIQIPVLLGGAAINQEFVDGLTPPMNEKTGITHYCKDAFAGLSFLNSYLSKCNPVRPSNKLNSNEPAVKEYPHQDKNFSVQMISFISTPPRPPFLGARKIEVIPVEEILGLVDKRALYRLSWGAKNASGEKWLELQKKFDDQFNLMCKTLLEQPWLHPQAVYGYFHVQSKGEELIIYEPKNEANQQVIERLHFPRQKAHPHLCLTDYFAPYDSGVMDTIAFQVVTVGKKAVERVEHFHKNDHYSESYFHHGLAVQMTEATAEYMEKQIRKDLILQAFPGKRYSWGYPGLPDLSEHQKIFELLSVPESLGLALTSAFQIVPEFSTAALFVHHPEARYFNAME